jgi:CRISPR/Cas system-associated exonuclease Cas4 (RecB family)
MSEPFDFNHLIDNHLAREFKPKTVGKYYPSEIGKCLRETWYTYKFPLPTPTELVKIFEAGNILHHFVAEVMRSEKNPHVQLLETELPFKLQIRDFVVSGRIDNLLLVKADNRKLLVEVKSTSRLDQDGPQPQHVQQLQLYMHALKIQDGVLLYIEKNTLRCQTYTVPYHEGEAAVVLDRFSRLHTHLTAGTLPLPEARVRDELGWMCRRCAYRERCFSETPDNQLSLHQFNGHAPAPQPAPSQS